MDDTMEAAEAKARLENDKAEARRVASAAAAKRRRSKNATESKNEREAKARELDDLLKKSAAFSDILTKKTEVLGRVGSSLNGQTLGEHDLKMAAQPKCMVGGTMRDYQLEGLTWMYEICLQGMSGILADEMGLGKTVQTIALIALLREQEGYLGPHLIIAPLSTLSNWIDEFHRWVPSIPVVLYHGDPQTRDELRKTKITKHLEGGGRPTTKFPVVCTSYEIILRDRAHLAKINWEFIIIDEGHRMKNFDSKLFRELRTFRSATRLLITGTPLQNNLKELWSLLNFLLPTIFVNWDAFESWFDFSDLQDEEGTEEFIADRMKQDLVKKIHMILQPLLLRRIKADVASYLPKKREYVLYAPMTKAQTNLYNSISDKNVDTRAYLEGQMLAHLESIAARNKAQAKPSLELETKPTSKTKAKTKAKAKSRIKLKVEAVDDERTMPIRTHDATASSPNPTDKKNAFAMMMSRTSRPVTQVPTPPASTTSSSTTTKTARGSSKRRLDPLSTASDSSPPPSKSAKSSRQSTPSAPVVSTRATRQSRRLATDDNSDTNSAQRRAEYAEPDSDDDLLSDDEFEEKLAAEETLREQRAKDAKPELDPEDAAWAQMVEVAKRQVATKKLGNPLMQLRLVCNSPHNFFNPWSVADDVAPARSSASSPSSTPEPLDDAKPDESLVDASGKMLLLDRLLPALFARGHKVLIFSQFKTQLDLLHDYCQSLRGWPVCRIDGSVAQDSRRQQIHDFNTSDEYKVFLLSTRAGGQGINLASADTVILFDSDWNPQQDLQAQDRCHRIGQTRPVIVYRLATRGTVEEELLMSADAKRRLEKLVIRKAGFAKGATARAAKPGKVGKRSRNANDDNDEASDEEDENDDDDDDDNELDQETLKSLLLKDGLVYQVSNNAEILSEQDLDVLCDRSDDAYRRAATGLGNATGFKIIETGANGITATESTA